MTTARKAHQELQHQMTPKEVDASTVVTSNDGKEAGSSRVGTSDDGKEVGSSRITTSDDIKEAGSLTVVTLTDNCSAHDSELSLNIQIYIYLINMSSCI